MENIINENNKAFELVGELYDYCSSRDDCSECIFSDSCKDGVALFSYAFKQLASERKEEIEKMFEEKKESDARNARKEGLIAKIKARAIAEEEKKRKKEEEEQKRWKEAEESIFKLGSRINNLLDLVNICIKSGIKVYKDAGRRSTYTNNFFEADGIYHHLGFNSFLESNLVYKNEITELTIKNGGYNGDIDLRVGKDGIAHGVYCGSYHTGEYTKPRTEDMEKFLREFDEFEKQFLDFVDNL